MQSVRVSSVHDELISESKLACNSSTRVFLFDGIPSVVVSKFDCQPRIGKLYGMREASGQLVAYHTLESRRGNGFATAALIETIKRSHVNVFASIYLDNKESIAVARKAGMSEIARGTWDKKTVVLFM